MSVNDRTLPVVEKFYRATSPQSLVGKTIKWLDVWAGIPTEGVSEIIDAEAYGSVLVSRNSAAMGQWIAPSVGVVLAKSHRSGAAPHGSAHRISTRDTDDGRFTVDYGGGVETFDHDVLPAAMAVAIEGLALGRPTIFETVEDTVDSDVQVYGQTRYAFPFTPSFLTLQTGALEDVNITLGLAKVGNPPQPLTVRIVPAGPDGMPANLGVIATGTVAAGDVGVVQAEFNVALETPGLFSYGRYWVQVFTNDGDGDNHYLLGTNETGVDPLWYDASFGNWAMWAGESPVVIIGGNLWADLPVTVVRNDVFPRTGYDWLVSFHPAAGPRALPTVDSAVAPNALSQTAPGLETILERWDVADHTWVEMLDVAARWFDDLANEEDGATVEHLIPLVGVGKMRIRWVTTGAAPPGMIRMGAVFNIQTAP